MTLNVQYLTKTKWLYLTKNKNKTVIVEKWIMNFVSIDKNFRK